MSALVEWREQYERETGDNAPERPARLYVRRFPSVYTQAGKRWIEDCQQWELRFLEWLRTRIEAGSVT